MVKQDKYNRTSINFGEKGDPAVVLKKYVTDYYGKSALSGLVRRAFVVCYGDKPEFKKYKIQVKMVELREAIDNKIRYAKMQNLIKDELKELGLSEQQIEDEIMG